MNQVTSRKRWEVRGMVGILFADFGQWDDRTNKGTRFAVEFLQPPKPTGTSY